MKRKSDTYFSFWSKEGADTLDVVKTLKFSIELTKLKTSNLDLLYSRTSLCSFAILFSLPFDKGKFSK